MTQTLNQLELNTVIAFSTFSDKIKHTVQYSNTQNVINFVLVIYISHPKMKVC